MAKGKWQMGNHLKFAICRLPFDGNVGHVYQPQLIDILFQLFNQVAFGNLLMEKVVEGFHPRVANPSDDLEAFGHRPEVIAQILPSRIGFPSRRQARRTAF
jgi:hypothetical protein